MLVDSNPFSPEKIAASESLLYPKLSPDGSKVVCHVKPAYNAGDHMTSALWIADTAKAGSARQLTAGLFNDTAGVFHPDGQRVIFLSDRHKAGGPAQLYTLHLDGGEAAPLVGKDNKKAVSNFEVSPDGRFIAFTSADEPTDEDEKKEKEKDDAQVSWNKKDCEKLKLYTFATSDVRSLNVPMERHVQSFTWKHDSTQILFYSWRQKKLEFEEYETPLERIDITKGDSQAQFVGSYPRAPVSSIIWTATGDIVEMQSFDPRLISDASAVFSHPSNDFTKSKRLYGEMEDVARVVDLKNKGLIAVEVANGVESRIEIVQGGKQLFTLFETHDDAIQSQLWESWDARCLQDGSYVFVVILTSSVRHEPLNVWSGRAASGEKVSPMTLLSDHMKWMHDAPALTSYTFQWKAADGTDLQGILTSPEGSSTPLPAIILVHGGPYWRDVLDYAPTCSRWRQLLSSRGYLTLSPNYRGSLGRGSAFARTAHAGAGTLDWADCAGMLDEAVARGLADPARLGIGGWSMGGFMTAWGVTAAKSRFRAGVMGAGVADWGAMAAESDVPDAQVDLSGSAPWTVGERIDLKRSPISYVEGVETAVLILHGEKDERVPVTQAISFMRGLQRQAKYPERSQLVIYPREGHAFNERKHAEDVMKRVIEHFDTWLS